MQLRVLLKKDVMALFKERSVIFTLLFPTLIIIFIGLIPIFITTSDPFEIGYLIEDQGIKSGNTTLNIGDLIEQELIEMVDSDETIVLLELLSYQDFLDHPNALWIPENFTSVANKTRIATYFITVSDTNLRSSSIMTGTVSQIVNQKVLQNLLPVDTPEVNAMQVYPEGDLISGEAKNRGNVARGMAYIAFLILIMGSSTMRITGFSAEKEADMMEILLSSVIKRREMILSKLFTGVLFGFASMLSYLLGVLIVVVVSISLPGDTESLLSLIPSGIVNPVTAIAIFYLFIMLSFISMELLLVAQLKLGKEGGDRLGSTMLMLLTFTFYATSIADPLSETFIQIINPFYWPFKLVMNIIFRENLLSSIIYFGLNLLFISYLLLVQTRAIEQEKVLFE